MKTTYFNLKTINSLLNYFFQNRVSLNAVSNMFGRLWSSILSLLSVPILFRHLGSEAYGLVGLYVSFEVVFNFLDLGLSATINREVARNVATNRPDAETRNLLRTFEFLYWPIGFMIAFLIFFLADWIAQYWVNAQSLSIQTIRISIYVMAIMFAARWPRTLYVGAFCGLQKQLLLNIISTIAVTVRIFTAIILLCYISQSIMMYLSWQAVSFILEVFLLRAFIWKDVNKKSVGKPCMDLQILKKNWRFALSFNIVGVFGMVLAQAGVVIATKFLGLSEVGYYSIAGTAAGSLTLISASISNAIYPRFSGNTACNNNQIVSRDFHQSIRIINYFTFGFGFILVLFPFNIIYWWTGDLRVAYHTYLLLFFLGLAGLFNSLAEPGYSLLVASGNTKVPLLCNLCNLILFIPALLIFLPRYGIVSAAIALFLENVIACVIYVCFVGKFILRESYVEYFKNDIFPYLIMCLLWFPGGKLICLFVENEAIKLAIIILALSAYFVSMAPHMIKGIKLREVRPVENVSLYL